MAALTLLAGCFERARRPTPVEVRKQVMRLLPAYVKDKPGWAADIQIAFEALDLEPSNENLCAALAVTEQESSFQADPEVPGLGRIALAEIERRAAGLHVPRLALHGALALASPDGRSWRERIAAVRTERELSYLFEEMIDRVPLGRRLLARANPVHTGGPMQVSVAFAERHARRHRYPFPSQDSVRHEVFTRHGGMYFGIAHLLGYPAGYDRPLYRFADFNAGWYASRNAAFQKALSIAADVSLDLDGDVLPGRVRRGDPPGATEAAALRIARLLDLSPEAIRDALQEADGLEFERTALYTRVFRLAEQARGAPLPRAVVPKIVLKSPKITRRLTTAWFAERVDTRYRRCLARAPGA